MQKDAVELFGSLDTFVRATNVDLPSLEDLQTPDEIRGSTMKHPAVGARNALIPPQVTGGHHKCRFLCLVDTRGPSPLQLAVPNRLLAVVRVEVLSGAELLSQRRRGPVMGEITVPGSGASGEGDAGRSRPRERERQIAGATALLFTLATAVLPFSAIAVVLMNEGRERVASIETKTRDLAEAYQLIVNDAISEHMHAADRRAQRTISILVKLFNFTISNLP